MIMLCSQCGTKLAQNSIYCSSCGKNIKNQPASPPNSKSNHSQNLGVDKNKLKMLLFAVMSVDGSMLVSAILVGSAVGMIFCTLFLAIVFYAYKNLQQNKYSEAKSYCLAGAFLHGIFAISNISALNQLNVIATFSSEVSAACCLLTVYYELNSKVKD
jgi:hypothetical protein